MKEVVTTTAIATTTGFLSWFFTKLQTRRERKKSDFQMIQEAISPLVISIGQLTEQNREIVDKLLAEQDKVLQLMTEKATLMREKGELVDKIEKLEKQVHGLQKKINEFIKKQENEK